MGDLKYKEHIGLTGQQLDGLAAMVALAVLFYVIKVILPWGGYSTTPTEPFSYRGKGTLAIALNLDEQEQGVYFMPPEATISDLLLAIGTTIPREFDRGMVSRRLLTGDKVYLTSVLPSYPVLGKMRAAQSLALDLPVDINKASLEELILVPGVGEKTAAQIIALREAKGSIRSLEELTELSGIKNKKLDKLKNYFFALP